MKQILIILLLLVGFISEGNAKFKYPKDYVSPVERKINRCLLRFDSDHDGSLTLEDYENYRIPRTREDRRVERHQRLEHGKRDERYEQWQVCVSLQRDYLGLGQ